MSTNPREIQQPPPPKPKQADGGNLKIEIEQIRRIVNGANKRLERLCEQIKDK